MTRDEGASLWPTDTLLLKERRTHYRTQISPMHWQLRSLISAERNDILYFPAGSNNTHISRLNTTTRDCETIKIISFPPRCLVAKNGWICCGGEYGELAVIRDVGQTDGTDDDAIARDSRTALNNLESSNLTEPSYAQLHRDMLSIVERINGSTKTWSASNHKFGAERINCITIWQPLRNSSAKPGAYTAPVGVLSNNDKTVTLVGLFDCEQLDHFEYPDCVNRAVISPDGTILVAILDDPYLYIHIRKPDSERSGSYVWEPVPKIQLRGQSKEDTSDCRGSFAATFSPSGRFLAVGTQYGTISIFRTAALGRLDEDPLVTWFNSFGSPQESGAVRDMAFSPGPHDLLAWTEHRGRIGIADARTGFRRRQEVPFDDLGDIDRVNLNDRNTIDPRLLDPRTERSAGASPSLPGMLGQRGSPRPQTTNPPDSNEPSSRWNRPFTPEETAVLEAVRSQTERRRRETAGRDRDHRDQQNLRNNAPWRPSMWAERVSPMPPPLHTLHTPAPFLSVTGASSSRDRVRSNLSTQRETLTRILERERMRESRDQQRSATTQTASEQDRERRAPTPRRRNSIMMALNQYFDNGQQESGRYASPHHTGPAAGETATESRGSPTPWLTQRLSSGWADLETLYSLANTDSNSNEPPRVETNSTSLPRRVVPISGLGDVWNAEPSGLHRYRRFTQAARDYPQFPDDTAGLSWSEDGQTLYIGTENGIFEFQVDMGGRKSFPDIVLR